MIVLMRWLARWPLHRLQVVGAALGWLAWAFSATYRRRLQANAALAGLGASQRRQAVAEAGRMAAEVPWLWLMPADETLGNRVRWQGAEHIEQALAAGRGALLLTPHLGSFEVSARAIVERFGHLQPLTVLYRPARQAWLREMEETARQRPGLATAPAAMTGVRQMLRALRRGELVGLLPDQVPPQGQGVWAPFFGQPAYTMTLATRLIQQTGAVPVILWCERLPRGAGFVMHVSALGAPLPEAGDTSDAAQVAAASAINRAMERVIAEAPGQYLWGYHRYKQPRRAATAVSEAAP
jgi:Kdo2-lipid IVA lauroyltransferase/acyltransferase